MTSYNFYVSTVVEISIRYPVKLLLILLLLLKYLLKFVCDTKIRWILLYILDFITTFHPKNL